MKVATGKVVGGKVVLEGEPLAEGSVVTVVARDDEEAFDVSPDEERALLQAIAQADRGQVVSWEELREQLRRSVGASRFDSKSRTTLGPRSRRRQRGGPKTGRPPPKRSLKILTTSLACFVCNPPWAQGHAVPVCQASAESRSFEFGTTCTTE